MYRGEGQIRVGGQVVDVEWDVSIQRVLIGSWLRGRDARTRIERIPERMSSCPEVATW